MKVTIFYTVPQIEEMDRTMVLEALDWYIQKESGYVDNDGRDLEYYEEDVVDWVYQVIDKIEEEEK